MPNTFGEDTYGDRLVDAYLPKKPRQMRIMGQVGDTKLVWDADNAEEVKNAKRTFDDLRGKRFLAFSVKKDGSKGVQITAFDPDAEKIIMVPAMQGG
jgi:hypothetical protein